MKADGPNGTGFCTLEEVKDEKSAETPGERMAEVRKMMGWSQSDLAKAAGLSRSTVSRLEGNLLSPDHPSMQQCLEAMRLTPEVVDQVMNPQSDVNTPGQINPADPKEMEQLQKELDMLTHLYPLLTYSSRSIIMSVLWGEMRHLKGQDLLYSWKTIDNLFSDWSKRVTELLEKTSGK